MTGLPERPLNVWGRQVFSYAGFMAVQCGLAAVLEGTRIADFTWVLAGPFATRMLGDLGADVIRIQNEERSTLVNRPEHPYYFVWNPRLVYVTMSGCGHDGPWQQMISYAPTIHAVCGITQLTNFPDRGDVGPGYSLNDHLAGFADASTTLAGLYARQRSGRGQKIDMAQLEVGSYVIGPALIDHFANRRDAEPLGNVDGLQDHVPNEVYACTDGFMADSVTNAQQWASAGRDTR